MGGWFKSAAYLLPFAHAVDMGRAALRGDYAAIWPHLAVVLCWAVAVLAAAIFAFHHKRRSDRL